MIYGFVKNRTFVLNWHARLCVFLCDISGKRPVGVPNSVGICSAIYWSMYVAECALCPWEEINYKLLHGSCTLRSKHCFSTLAAYRNRSAVLCIHFCSLTLRAKHYFSTMAVYRNRSAVRTLLFAYIMCTSIDVLRHTMVLCKLLLLTFLSFNCMCVTKMCKICLK